MDKVKIKGYRQYEENKWKELKGIMNKIFSSIGMRRKWILNVVMLIGILTPISLFAQTKVGNDSQLRAAIANGGEILVTASFSLSDQLNISKDVVLDLGGNTIKYEKYIEWYQTGENSDLINCSGGNITIINGTIINRLTNTFAGRATTIQVTGGKTIITNCSINAYTEGLGRDGTAIWYKGGDVQIIKGTFVGTGTKGKGYALYSDSKNIDDLTKGCLVKKDGTSLTDLGKTIEGTATVSPIDFKITYDTNNGKIISSGYTTAYSILNDGESRTLPTIERSNYKFLYWYNNSSGNVNEDIAITPSSFPYKNIDGKDEQTVTLKAKWEAIPYTIKYNTDGGNSIADITYTVESAPELSTPVKDGYLFMGWFNGNTPVTSLEGQSGNMTLTAHWSEYKYTLSFVTNGETKPAQQNYTKKTVGSGSIPTTWERKGYTFEGWYDNEKYEGTQVTARPCPQDGKIVLVSITLYAKWKPISYDITYTLNEGTNPANAPTSYTIAQTPLQLPVPKRESSTFIGWYENSSFSGNSVEAIAQNTIGDKHYYAKWVVTYHATCHWNSSTNPDKPNTIISFTKEEEKTLPVWTEIDGYEIQGWCKDKSLNGEILKVIPKGTATNMDLYAKWKLAVYSITYEAYHGIIPAESPKSYTIESGEITLPHAMRDGFTFAGWYTTAALTERVGVLDKDAVGNKTFYAKWVTGNLVSFERPAHGGLTVKNGTTEVKNGEKVGAKTKLTITATPESSVYKLSKLIINGEPYTSSPQTISMPEAGGLTVSAEFTDPRPVATSPGITTDPVNTDYIPAGGNVTVTLNKKDNSTTLYYSIDGSTPKAYTQPFQVSSLEANKVLKISAIARKDGHKDGITTRDIKFGSGKITISFNLPKGITATNPLGGEVVSAVASGGTFQFKLDVDKNYFVTLDSLRVEANGKIINPDVYGVFTLSEQKANVTIKVSGITGTTYTLSLIQKPHGRIFFTDDDSTFTRVVNRGDRISVTAEADEDYKFVSWTDGNQTNPREIIAESNMNLQANFVTDLDHYVVVFPTMKGVTVKTLTNYSQEVKHGGTCKFYLRLDADYNQSVPVVKANGEVLTVNKEVYSLFNIKNNYSISVSGIQKNKVRVEAIEHVTITNVETMTDATKLDLLPEAVVNMYAKAPAGKVFLKWNDGKADNPRISTAQDASQLLPLFTTSTSGETFGKVVFNTPVGAGVSVINANADAVKTGGDLQFKIVVLPQYSRSKIKVTADDKEIQSELELRASTETTSFIYTLKGVTGDTKINVSGLILNDYTLVIEQKAGGTIRASQSGSLKYGTGVTLSATPTTGNMFVKWSDGNTLNPYPYKVIEDMTMNAVFVQSNSPVHNEIKPSLGRVYIAENILHIDADTPENLYIWNYNGQLIHNTYIQAGHSTFHLPQGNYVIKTGDNQPIKISVR